MIEETYTVDRQEYSLEQLQDTAELALSEGSPFQVESKKSSTGTSAVVSASAHSVNIVRSGDDYSIIATAPQEAHDILQRSINSNNGREDNTNSERGGSDEMPERSFEDISQEPNDPPQTAGGDSVQAEVTIFEDGTVKVDKMGGESRTMQTAAGFFLLAGEGDDGKLNVGEAYTVEQFGKQYRESDIRRAVHSIEETLSEM